MTMERDEHITWVMFRIDRHEVTAVFPELPHDRRGLWMTCYSHVGQHGSCEWRWVKEKTRPATDEQAASLKRELESLGYRLAVARRRTKAHREMYDRQVSQEWRAVA